MHGKALEIDQTEERISKLYDKNLEKNSGGGRARTELKKHTHKLQNPIRTI